MKDSGIEWVGPIPEHWKVVKNNRLFRITKTLVGDEWENTQLLSLTKGGIIEKDINDGGGKQPESFSTYQFVQKDDIVLCLFDIDVSAVFSDKSSFDGMISPAYRVMKCSKSILPTYAKWWFDAVNIGRYYLIYTKSLRKTIDSEGFGNILTAVPPLEEQQAIASYLDDRCSKLDELITEAEKSIEEYKELKQAVIFEAVTKGLDKNVPMKDSRVEWLGEVPTTWVIVRLKYLLTHLIDCPHETPNYAPDGDYYVIRTADQDLGALRPDKNMYRLNEKEYINRIRRAALEKDDIVYGREGERWGLACIIPENKKYCLGQRMLHFRCNIDKIVPRFLMWALNSSGVRMQGVLDTMGSTSPHVNISTVRNFFIPVPDMKSQINIADFLDNRVGDIDSLVSEKQSLIEDLQAYKKSLIYEVVTGKRRVV